MNNSRRSSPSLLRRMKGVNWCACGCVLFQLPPSKPCNVVLFSDSFEKQSYVTLQTDPLQLWQAEIASNALVAPRTLVSRNLCRREAERQLKTMTAIFQGVPSTICRSWGLSAHRRFTSQMLLDPKPWTFITWYDCPLCLGTC